MAAPKLTRRDLMFGGKDTHYHLIGYGGWFLEKKGNWRGHKLSRYELYLDLVSGKYTLGVRSAWPKDYQEVKNLNALHSSWNLISSAWKTQRPDNHELRKNRNPDLNALLASLTNLPKALPCDIDTRPRLIPQYQAMAKKHLHNLIQKI